MSEADKLFKKLNYKRKYCRDIWGNAWGVDFTNKYEYKSITFDFIDKEVCSSTQCYDRDGVLAVYINMKELKAINMKCKELGWYE